LEPYLTHTSKHLPAYPVSTDSIRTAQYETLQLPPFYFIAYGIYTFLNQVEIIIFDIKLSVAFLIPVFQFVANILGTSCLIFGSNAMAGAKNTLIWTASAGVYTNFVKIFA
jgi:hypothetical protein